MEKNSVAQNHVKMAWLHSNYRLILRLYKRVTTYMFSEQNELKGKHRYCQIHLMVLTDAFITNLITAGQTIQSGYLMLLIDKGLENEMGYDRDKKHWIYLHINCYINVSN